MKTLRTLLSLALLMAALVFCAPAFAQTWSQMTDPWTSGYQFWQWKMGTDGHTPYVCATGTGSNAGLAFTTNHGSSWTLVSGCPANITAFCFNALGNPVVAESTGGTTFVGVFYYNGSSFVAATGITATLRVTDIEQYPGGHLIAITRDNAKVYHSTDNGATWSALTTTTIPSVELLSLAFAPDGTIAVGGAGSGTSQSNIWTAPSENGTWVNTLFTESAGSPNFDGNAYAVLFNSTNVLYCANQEHVSGNVLYTGGTDGAGTPTVAETGLPNFSNVHQVVIDPGGITVSLVAQSGHVNGGIYRANVGTTYVQSTSGWPANADSEGFIEDASTGQIYANARNGSTDTLWTITGLGTGTGSGGGSSGSVGKVFSWAVC